MSEDKKEDKKEDAPLPYSKKIDDIYTAVDSAFIDALNKEKPSFTEIEIVMMLLKNKFDEEKLKAYLTYWSDTSETPDKPDDTNMYK
jgi:hypothetical protein